MQESSENLEQQEPRFTKGPWAVDWRHSERWASIDANGWNEFATVNGNFDDEELHEQGLANAALIATSPDLYHELAFIVTKFEDVYDGADGEWPWSGAGQDIERITKLLARARGEGEQ